MSKNYSNEIKEQFLNDEVYQNVKDFSKNKHQLDTYYNVGKLLIEAQGGEERAKYGNKLIEEYSKRLTNELGKKYNKRYLFDIRKFYLFTKVHPLDAQLSISHYRILMTLKNKNEIDYYINECIKYNLSKRQLRERIKSKEYERLPESTKNKLIKKEELKIQDLIKNPIEIKTDKEIISEKILQPVILDNMKEFLKQLGDGFCFIENEYKIKVGNEYNYIDLLLFNYIYNSFVVIELKVTELKKEHLGQIQVYMNYIDQNVKTINHNKTIGIIICREDNHFIMKYCSDDRIFTTKYIIKEIV